MCPFPVLLSPERQEVGRLALRLISLCISQGQLLSKEQGGSEVVVREETAELKA